MSLFRRFLPQPRNAYISDRPPVAFSLALLIDCFFDAAAELSGCHFWVTRLHPRLIPVGRPLALVPFTRARSSVGLIGWAGEPTGRAGQADIVLFTLRLFAWAAIQLFSFPTRYACN